MRRKLLLLLLLLNPTRQRLSQLEEKAAYPTIILSHYESQGLNSQEASIKVIEDLHNAFYRVFSSGRGRKDKLMANTSRKVDIASSKLAILDMKVESKPRYGEAFAIGVPSGVTL
ncbi:hypothetical protein CIPAW_01G094100 [Carya illinoinensis]|uniref:Uncharacterized protein n=1 Tax=Carya illinoinensis TaxID=32201 RepID=A0A8T1RKZ8_CARIL|nr:hypothetical protein CIPAW_01G094100 [Carya illinoinensis]